VVFLVKFYSASVRAYFGVGAKAAAPLAAPAASPIPAMPQAALVPRPRWVTGLAMFLLVSAGIPLGALSFVLVGGLLLEVAYSLGGAAARAAIDSETASGLLQSTGLFALSQLSFGVANVVCGVGLLKGWRWARPLALVLLWTGAAAGGVAFFASVASMPDSGARGYLAALVSLAWGSLSVVFLVKLSGAPVRAYLGTGVKAAPPPAPGRPSG